jgi:hypothetical protein
LTLAAKALQNYLRRPTFSSYRASFSANSAVYQRQGGKISAALARNLDLICARSETILPYECLFPNKKRGCPGGAKPALQLEKVFFVV